MAVAQPFVGAESDGLPELTRGIVPAEELGLGGEAAQLTTVVNETAGSPEFDERVGRARSISPIVVAVGAWPEELIEATGYSAGNVQPTLPREGNDVVSFFATYPSRRPTYGSYRLMGDFTEEQFREDVSEFLNEVVELYKFNRKYGRDLDPKLEPFASKDAVDVQYLVGRPDQVVEVQQASYINPDLRARDDFYDGWGFYPDRGKLTVHMQNWIKWDDGSNYNDFWIVKHSVLSEPGASVWPDSSDWQIAEHRWKYDTPHPPRFVADYDPNTQPSSSTYTVTLDSNGVLATSYSYTIPDVTLTTASNISGDPSWVKWTHEFARNKNCAIYSYWARPGLTLEVPQNDTFSVHKVGTVVWREPHWYGDTFDTWNNLMNDTWTTSK